MKEGLGFIICTEHIHTQQLQGQVFFFFFFLSLIPGENIISVPSAGPTVNIKQQVGSVNGFYRFKALYVSSSQHQLPEFAQKLLSSQKT